MVVTIKLKSFYARFRVEVIRRIANIPAEIKWELLSTTLDESPAGWNLINKEWLDEHESEITEKILEHLSERLIAA